MRTDAKAGRGPIEGLRVIDLTHVMAGPTCTLMLADMGADVIKVERMPDGDDSRRSVPPTIGSESAAFLMMNRNKRGIAVDLKTEGGKQVLAKLLEGADVLVENFRPGTLDRLGFGIADLEARYPRLIYCSLTGFGRTGPYSRRGGFDLVAQAMSGIMSVTGEGPGRPPVKCGAPLTDITCGLLAAMGILAACAERERSGRGQQVDTSLFEAGIIHTYWQSAIALATGIAPSPMGSAHPLNAPYEAFACADGWIVVGGASPRNWSRLVEVLEAPSLAEDPRFVDNAARMAHLDELREILAPLFRAKTREQMLDALEGAGVPAGPVNDVIEMHADPQARARAMVVVTDHPTLGAVETIGLPIKFSATPGGVHTGAPLFAQHTREVLLEAGVAAAEIERLAADGAIALGPAGGPAA